MAGAAAGLQNRQPGFQNETWPSSRLRSQLRNFHSSPYQTINYRRGSPVAISTAAMRISRNAERGFSVVELMLTVAFAATVLTIAVPVLTDVSDSSKLNGAAREIEREFQAARLKAVSANRLLRVRLNCPGTGLYRTIEYVASPAVDNAGNRCSESAYPFPADNDIMTRPNYDGPVRVLPLGATVTTNILQFNPDGTAFSVVSNVVTPIAAPVVITVTRKGKSKSITVNAAGKIQLQ
jgi:Tfp pilus assembly protein FimT